MLAIHFFLNSLNIHTFQSHLTSNCCRLILLAQRSLNCLSVHKLKPTGKALWICNRRNLILWSISSNFPTNSMSNDLLQSKCPGNSIEMNDWQMWFGAYLAVVEHQHVRTAYFMLFLKDFIDQRQFQGSFKVPSKVFIYISSLTNMDQNDKKKKGKKKW